jgi:hypothetical protein
MSARRAPQIRARLYHTPIEAPLPWTTDRSTKEVLLKRFIATLSLALFAFPGAALAAPGGQPNSGSPLISGAPPNVAHHWARDQLVPSDLPAYPRAYPHDVAAAHQQATAHAPAPARTSAASDFDWADAGIGAAVATGVLALALAGVVTVQRRQSRRGPALAG